MWLRKIHLSFFHLTYIGKIEFLIIHILYKNDNIRIMEFIVPIENIHSELVDNLVKDFNIFKILKLIDCDILSSLIDYDTKIVKNDFRLVGLACEKNYTQLVIWLVEHDFYHDSISDTIEFAINGNFELMSYYNKLNKEFSPYVPRKLIENNFLYLLKWMFDNELVNKAHSDYKKNYLMLYAVRYNNVRILEYLSKEQKMNLNFPDFNNLITLYDLDLNFGVNKVSDETLEWLWTNGYYWTESHAKNYNNKFMLNKFNKNI